MSNKESETTSLTKSTESIDKNNAICADLFPVLFALIFQYLSNNHQSEETNETFLNHREKFLHIIGCDSVTETEFNSS